MALPPKGCSRRDFIKTTGAIGVGTLLSPVAATARSKTRAFEGLLAADRAKVPTRPFGNTGVDVSMLSLGGMFDIGANQLMLRQALQWGVTYWDTADCYQSGSETGIGKYFARYPQDRQKVFLVSKSDARDPEGMSALLERSLKRMNTSYVDLYFVHGVREIDELGDATQRWARKAKDQKKIKFFGFSTHSNMEELLAAAPGLGYIDGIMMTYNFRNMESPGMKAGVAACVKAGIGLTAMKTQAGRSWLSPGKASKAGEELMAALLQKGVTEEQANLMAVWNNPHIASICSQMPNMTILKANVEAAANHSTLTSHETHLFRQYARTTAAQYCTGCSRICETAVEGAVPIGDIMRYHMYSQSYGQLDWARTHFKALPSRLVERIPDIDYSEAEDQCPQKMPIAQLMRKAVSDFG